MKALIAILVAVLQVLLPALFKASKKTGEPLENNVINFVSPSGDSLLKQMDGEEVEVASGKITIKRRNARVERG